MIENRDELFKKAEQCKTRADFIEFVVALIGDLRQNPEDWENDTLENYLEALYGYSMDIDGYYKNFDIDVDADVASWRVFAEILVSATLYE